MNRNSRFLCVAVFLVLSTGAVATMCDAQTMLVQDDFSDGDRENNPAWFRVGQQAGFNVDVVNDPTGPLGGLGSGNALRLDLNASATNQSMVIATQFSEVTLANVGDYIELTFDMRWENLDPIIARNNAFRFGLFDAHDSATQSHVVLTGDGTNSAAQGGYGYFAQADLGPVASAPGVELRRQRLGFGWFNSAEGVDRFAGTSPPGSAIDPYAIENDGPDSEISLKHSVLFRVERVAAAGSLGADFNQDGVADGADFLIWQRNVGLAGSATPGDGDANGDANVDGADLEIWRSDFGQAASGSDLLVTVNVTGPGETHDPYSAKVVDNPSLSLFGTQTVIPVVDTFTFDTVGIGSRGHNVPDDFYIDNVLVTTNVTSSVASVVPEPASWLLAMVVGLCLACGGDRDRQASRVAKRF